MGVFRFRYESENQQGGVLSGASSSKERQTYPAIKVLAPVKQTYIPSSVNVVPATLAPVSIHVYASLALPIQITNLSVMLLLSHKPPRLYRHTCIAATVWHCQTGACVLVLLAWCDMSTAVSLKADWGVISVLYDEVIVLYYWIISRFRYECEGRTAGSILGKASTNEHKTFPSIKVESPSHTIMTVICLNYFTVTLWLVSNFILTNQCSIRCFLEAIMYKGRGGHLWRSNGYLVLWLVLSFISFLSCIARRCGPSLICITHTHMLDGKTWIMEWNFPTTKLPQYSIQIKLF